MTLLNLIFLVPVFFIFIGLLYIFIVAKNRKYPIGYKLYGARKSDKNWSYTQKTVGKIYLFFGGIGVIMNIIYYLIGVFGVTQILKGTLVYNIFRFGPAIFVVAGSIISITLIKSKLNEFYSK